MVEATAAYLCENSPATLELEGIVDRHPMNATIILHAAALLVGAAIFLSILGGQ